jgi:transposase
MTLPLLVGDPQALPVLARDGTWDRALAELRRQVRHAHGRNPEPSAGVIDSCSINASPVWWFSRPRQRQEVRRHQTYVVVDTLGVLVAVLVTEASVQARAAGAPAARPSLLLLPRLGHL